MRRSCLERLRLRSIDAVWGIFQTSELFHPLYPARAQHCIPASSHRCGDCCAGFAAAYTYRYFSFLLSLVEVFTNILVISSTWSSASPVPAGTSSLAGGAVRS